MKLPPAIDAAMWELAESSDQAALDAFVDRYPEYKAELTQRVRMVRGLRGFKPPSKAKERFVPVRETLSMPTTNRWAVPLAATLVLGSVVFAAVSFTHWLDIRNTAAQQGPDVPKGKNLAVSPKLKGGGEPRPIHRGTPDGGALPTVPPPQTPNTPWENAVTFKTDRAVLADALVEIASQAGISLEIAPGMPDVEIEADYQGQPAKLVMQDMGKNFGFTVLIETQNTGLVVPAVDPHAPPPERVAGTSTVAQDIKPEGDRSP